MIFENINRHPKFILIALHVLPLAAVGFPQITWGYCNCNVSCQVLSTAFEKSEAMGSNFLIRSVMVCHCNIVIFMFFPGILPFPTVDKSHPLIFETHHFFWTEVVMVTAGCLLFLLGGFVGVAVFPSGFPNDVRKKLPGNGWKRHGSVSRAEDDGAETVGGGHHWESRLQYQGRGEQTSLAKGRLWI